MRVRFAHQAVVGIVLICQFSLGLATETPDPNDTSKYLNAVRTFADNVLKYGRDTYGPKHTPLFVDGLNVNTHEPVKWIAPNGDRWILSNLASQQNLFRTLDGLTRITGDPKYRQAAMDAIKYAFDNLRSPNGLLYWGMTYAYDADTDKVCSDVRHHSLRYHYPYYELMWQVSPHETRDYVESFWASHIFDWSTLDMNRYSSMDSYQVAKSWGNNYEGGDVFFAGKGIPFFSAGSDLFYASSIISKLSTETEPLIWAKRLAHRYVETRSPQVGISGTQYTISRDSAAEYQLGDDLKGHIVHTVPPRKGTRTWLSC
jgi:pectate lyase